MIIGIPKEIKTREYRVSMVPGGVKAFVDAGHKVFVEKGAGLGSGISDEEYKAVGAQILNSPKEVHERAEMIVKVKEPLPPEYEYMREGLIYYTYLHLAAAKEIAEVMMKKKVVGIAYETIQTDNGALPLLKPMSEVAGRMSVQVGARCLEKEHGGRGVLLGGVPGVKRGKVAILGAGVVGTNAAKMAIGMGAEVKILDTNLNRLEYLDDIFANKAITVFSDALSVEEAVCESDLIVGAVLIPGASAPKLIKRSHLPKMKKGSVVVDVAVDQGGCIETCKPTTHDDPTYEIDGVIHYCVANMPGAVPYTSTYALTNATLKYALEIANKGMEKALKDNPALQRGVNIFNGKCVHRAVAESLKMQFSEVKW
ncbi:MAG: alanine dehydrogenase [Phycisphaerae bacterium]|nr:alanine dehydrogenase [Phycisphaerae bacterium]